MVCLIVEAFSEKEIKEAAWDFDGNKSPNRMVLILILSNHVGRWLKLTL